MVSVASTPGTVVAPGLEAGLAGLDASERALVIRAHDFVVPLYADKQLGTGRDVKLEFLGVPIFYTPWITFPVGDQRKSGLLFPTIGSSNPRCVARPTAGRSCPSSDRCRSTSARYPSWRAPPIRPSRRWPSSWPAR